MVRPTINSIKHYVHVPVTVVNSGARTSFVVSTSVVAPATGNASDVREGSLVKAVYVEMWVDGVTASKTVNTCFIKLSAGSPVPSAAEMSNMGAYTNKKNVLEFHQGLAPSGGNIIPLYRGWIKIPKGKQRQGLQDVIRCVINAVGTNVNVCGFFTYKEYY